MMEEMQNRLTKDQQPLLDVRHLSVHFTRKRKRGGGKKIVKAVDDVSFFIRKGETFGLVGESGCGKTTTGRAIIRLYDYQQGEVFFEGQPIHGKMNGRLRKYITDNISMIFQDPIASLNPRMTVEEIIGEGLKLHGITSAEQRHQMVQQMLVKVGLSPEHATRYPHEFSGGQRQRIGIARALIVEPKLVIADEPVSALDVSVQAQVINLLNKLKAEMGLTILFIAHNLSVVKYFSDRIGVMYFGKLVELADCNELFRNPMHPYTRALFSAIPQPDPRSEQKRVKIEYTGPVARDSGEETDYHEIAPGHYVYGTKDEAAHWREERT